MVKLNTILTYEIKCDLRNYLHYRYKNGKEVSADARLKIMRDSKRSESYWLSLTIVKEQDAGEYEVRATNILGSVESKSIVTVVSKYSL